MEQGRPRCGHLVIMRTSPRPPASQSIGLVIDDDDRHCPFESLARAARGDAVLVLWSDSTVKNCRPAWIPSGLLRVVATGDDS